MQHPTAPPLPLYPTKEKGKALLPLPNCMQSVWYHCSWSLILSWWCCLNSSTFAHALPLPLPFNLSLLVVGHCSSYPTASSFCKKSREAKNKRRKPDLWLVGQYPICLFCIFTQFLHYCLSPNTWSSYCHVKSNPHWPFLPTSQTSQPRRGRALTTFTQLHMRRFCLIAPAVPPFTTST